MTTRTIKLENGVIFPNGDNGEYYVTKIKKTKRALRAVGPVCHGWPLWTGGTREVPITQEEATKLIDVGGRRK